MNGSPKFSIHFILLPVLALLAINVPAQDEWPVRFNADGVEYQLFTPQPESIDGNKFSARAAVSMQRSSDKQPVFGAIWGDGVLEVDRDSRLGRITRFTVDDARFPGVENEQELDAIRRNLSTAIPQNAPPMSLDWMISALEEEQGSGDQYVNDPPEIIYREKPTTLVFIDGEPRYEKLEGTVTAKGDPLYQPESRSSLERVVNTPFMIVRDGSGDHYLYGSRMWFRAKVLDGPWQRDENVPTELQELAAKVEDPAALTANDQASADPPEIIVRYAPAEMLDFKGKPDLQPVQNTSLLTVTNTNRSVFMDIKSQEYYFLASGRWFKTKDMASGNWEYVQSDRLPAEFRSIPEGSNRDMVLAHVAGTDAAREAARDAQIPQTARVDRNSVDLKVIYQGSPEFERIDGTNVEFSRNASADVLRIDGYYHVCDNGVWYEGPTPDGPWEVSTVVPEEVRQIPPSSPVYNVRYVYIYDHTPDIVYMGYTPGYLGSYVQHGVVIYGTGYYYRPWPVFWRPRPWTWGFGMYYDPWVGWGFGGGWGYGWMYPAWGMWARPYSYGCWWGPSAWYPPCCVSTSTTYYGHRPSVSGRMERSDLPAGTYRTGTSDNLYASVERKGVHATTVERSSLRQGTVATDQKEGRAAQDHFTDAAGNVYRQNGDRTQRYENGTWNKVVPVEKEPMERKPEPAGADRQPTRQQDQPDQRDRVTDPQRGNAPQSRPQQQARPDPIQIQRDRQRGVERQQKFERNTLPRITPKPSSRPGGVSPGRSPGGSRSGGTPPGGGGGNASPSRSSGGGRR